MSQDATPFALVVRFTVRPGAEADFDQLVARTAAGIRAYEPGTLVYAVHAVDGAPRERIFYELYRDRTAFADHEAQPHIGRFLAEREALLESKQVDFIVLTDGKLPVAPSALRTEASGVIDEDVPGE
jgi:quinol monooxygenase YgiN